MTAANESGCAVCARREQPREATKQALEAIYSGATFTEADALIDQLDDLGFRVVPK